MRRTSPSWVTSPDAGVFFTVAGVDDVPDLHGDIVEPELVIFLSGNQFMVTGDLIRAFQEDFPQYQRIFVETLPPGIMERQIEQGALVVGNLRIAIYPDVFTTGRKRILELDDTRDWFGRIVDYASNRLEIMVPKGNPKGITGLISLGRADVRVSMPNPEWEGIGKRILEAYRKAEGEMLVQRVMQEKVKEGSTYLTLIHHRETPRRILADQSDAGPVWHTEVFYQQDALDNPIEGVLIPDAENERATYSAASMKNASHPQAADDFLNFITGARGQEIYRRFGFGVE